MWKVNKYVIIFSLKVILALIINEQNILFSKLILYTSEFLKPCKKLVD